MRRDLCALAIGEMNGVGILVETCLSGLDQNGGGAGGRVGFDEEFSAVAEDEFFDEEDAIFRHGLACAMECDWRGSVEGSWARCSRAFIWS